MASKVIPLAPLIIYHTTFLPYLPFCLWQNTRTNPERECVLLGDRDNKIEGIPYTHIDTERYQERNSEFIRVYRHASNSHFGDERRCIERWFVLWEYLEKHRIRGFYFLDSDYLLFGDLSEFEFEWEKSGPCGTPGLFGLGYFPDAGLIGDLCNWILGLYQNDERFAAMRDRFHQAGEGLQEMGLIREFCRSEGVPVRKLSWRQSEMNPCFDDGFFGSSYRYNSKEFSRLMQKKAGGAVSVWDGRRDRRLLGLHFGGHQKNQIPGFTGWTPAVIRAFFRPNYRRNLKWLLQYFWNGCACRARLQRQSRKGPDR